ncbi:MAG: metal ABC transporter permease, partial [Spirochaetales bacterium]|nr:metal ABC transporter permease [Spirochaetales bacterium]
MIHSLVVLLLTTTSCSLLGVFLLLRNQSMITDAISHSVLLGIVGAFFVTRTIDSPFLVFGAALSGLVAVILIEKLGSSRFVRKDDAIGIIFPLFFSLAIIIISRYLKNAHLDTDCVLLGEVIFASLDTISVHGVEVARESIKAGIMLVINALFIISFYKELKLSTFDPELAKTIGMPAGFLFYTLMGLTSLTSVMAFNAVGSIIVISFFITSAATALLLSKNLINTLFIAIFFAILNSMEGTLLSVYFNVSMSGMTAFVSML